MKDPVIVSVVTALITSALGAAFTIPAIKTDIKWIKEYLMSLPCMDRRTGKREKCDL